MTAPAGRFNIVGRQGRWSLFHTPADGTQQRLGRVSKTRYGWRAATPADEVLGFKPSRAQAFKALAEHAGVTETPANGWTFGALVLR